ncbi:glycosyltransferase [Ruminococcus sp. OA3]|uniref:glycosyltransferase n=1 Tax=Ruminococcus sp. OA3 TaxID=2914164 RepID=UPI001F064A25|nr:glycosyltransferase [Ruminococcus sp. OA3]MCH1982947.1 glycosyltransferase [Ruminococcus sp. OA3]
MKTLCLFTNAFPYGNWEPYLETEIKFYNEFDKVWIFALQIREEHKNVRRSVGKNVSVIPVWYASRLTYLINALRAVFDADFYKEFLRLVKRRRFCIRNLINLFVFFSRAYYEAGIIEKKMKNQKLVGEVVFYSYRFEYQPYVAMILRKKWNLNCRIVARAHRYDLYEEEHRGAYIPMRQEILDEIDFVYPCSDDGTDYILNGYPEYKNKVATKFLGTLDRGIKEYEWKDFPYEIVTCSNVVKVKRLDKLIRAMSLIRDVEIKWTHYGDGLLMEDIKALAEKMLGANVTYEFKGNVDNTALLEDYMTENYYLFLNVSSSEGIPVSIMESSSVGIPCIATDVGGTREIITDGVNGILLSADVSDQELADRITRFCRLDRYQYLRFRKEARRLWDDKYNAEKNYLRFTNELFWQGSNKQIDSKR